MRIQTKRVYDDPEAGDGLRILVDRVWPRGKKKEEVEIDHWMKAVAPSSELRKWFHHDPEKWAEFKKRYFKELSRHKDELHRLLDEAGDGPLTLVFSAKDERHNNAAALREYLNKMKGGR